jgi:hypothetical protein
MRRENESYEKNINNEAIGGPVFRRMGLVGQSGAE